MKRTPNKIQEFFANHLKGNMFGLEHDFLIESTDPIQIKIAYRNQDQLKVRYNPLKEFDEKWLKAIMIDPKIENSTLFKTKKVFEYRDKVKPPSVKYMQIEPAPEGDTPMVETQVVTKNELTKPNSQPIYPDDVQLIKIEKKNDTTLITTHIKINNQWYKTQLQEYLLDLILDGETQQYYDDAQGKILVGV